MRRLAVLIIILISVAAGAVNLANNAFKAKPPPRRNFDQYGLIRWGDEQAHLDNFAIQLQNEPDDIGYIFVYDGNDVCEGEARARAIRAREYVVKYRGLGWNRVMWRYDGFAGEFSIALQPAPRAMKISDPWLGPFAYVPPIQHITDKCDLRLKRIRNSKPGKLD
jgi:hypothetical protein